MPAPERAGGGAAAQHLADHLDEGRVQRADIGRLLEVPRLVQVLLVQHGQEFRVLQEIAPGELDQPGDSGVRRQAFQVQRALGGADAGIGRLQHRQVQRLLVADMVVQHALVGAGGRGDAVDPGAAEAVPGELGQRRVQDALAHALRVALPARPGPARGGLDPVQGVVPAAPPICPQPTGGRKRKPRRRRLDRRRRLAQFAS